MALSHELISQFAKLVVQEKKTSAETTVYGTIVVDGDDKYVQIDGSDQWIPIEDGTTAVDANVDERVSVLIKNHTATVTGNVSSPAARTGDVKDLGDRVDEVEKFDIVLADRVEANEGYIKELQADVAEFGDLKAATAEIEELKAKDVVITGRLDASEATIENLKTTKLDAEVADVKFATIESLDATVADVAQLEANKASIEDLDAVEADIEDLTANKLDAEQAEIKYINIDFGNITEASIRSFFTKTGMIENVIIGDSTVTGALVGVTIKGDLIEAGTVKADKLVIKSSKDGLYYKLNIEAGAVASEQVTEEQLQNGLSGTAIIAKTITADKVKVTDLVAFGATIGGFKIDSDAIHSVVKDSVNNTTRGFYVDNDGQMAVGDANNFIKYFKDTDGQYKLIIASGGKTIDEAISDIEDSVKTNTEDLTEFIKTTTSEMENLQGQIDGSIMTWFYEYVPTNDNIPASEWTTVALKNNHLGDLFYDTITGYCYRWQVQNNQYSWNRITDVDVTKALADAAAAQSTADNKRRVFVDTPKPPYDVGDLWTQGSSGDLMRCKTAKTASQSYAVADWVKASKYTDDTAANQAQSDVNALKTRVTTAETSIEQSNESIRITAEKIDKLEIGGRNILLNSSFKEDIDEWTPSGDLLDTKKTVEGSGSIWIYDLASISRPMSVRLASNKNLFYFAEDLINSGENEYGSWSYEAKKGASKITLNTAAHETIGAIHLNIDLSYLLNQLDPNKRYTFSIVASSDRVWGMAFFGGGTPFDSTNGGSPVTFYPSQITDTTLMFEDWGSIGELRFQIEEGTTATEYAEANGAGSNISLLCGKNLCNDASLRDRLFNGNGTGEEIKDTLPVRFPSDDTPVTFSMKFTAKDITHGSSKNVVYLSFYPVVGSRISRYITVDDLQQGFYSFTPPVRLRRIDIRRYANWTGGSITIHSIQVELGETATEHEPYTYTSYTADERGVIDDVRAPVDLTGAIESTPAYPNTIVVVPNQFSAEVTYSVESGMTTKHGKPCLCINHIEQGQTKYARQSALDKLEPDTEYTLSGWALAENIVQGSTNFMLCLYHEGVTATGDNYSYGRASVPINAESGEWQRVSYTFRTRADVNTSLHENIYAYTRDFIGQVYFCNLKLEKGNKVTDWTPAPEDTDRAITDTSNAIYTEISNLSASIEETAEGIALSAAEINERIDGVDGKVTTATSDIAVLKVSAGSIAARVESVETGEFDQVKVKGKNFKMDSDGFTVEDINPETDRNIKTTISNNGMIVYDDDDPVLTANNEGVKAKDLHANTYLIIGKNSRFEDYANHTRTACFWIGN